MAKSAKPSIERAINPRSRTAKRALSPSLPGKSRTDIPRASDASPILGLRPHSNGIQKAKKKAKPLKRGQRARHEKGLARAEIVLDRLERKREDVQFRTKKVKRRAAGWEEINEEAEEEVRKTPKVLVGEGRKQNGNGGDDEGDDEGEWVDEIESGGDLEMKVVDGEEVEVPANAALTKVVVAVRTASNAGSDLEDIS